MGVVVFGFNWRNQIRLNDSMIERIVSDFFPGLWWIFHGYVSLQKGNQVFFELFRDSGIWTFPGDYCRPHQPFQMGAESPTFLCNRRVAEIVEGDSSTRGVAARRSPGCWGEGSTSFVLGDVFLGGGFKHFLFSSLPGEMIQFD